MLHIDTNKRWNANSKYDGEIMQDDRTLVVYHVKYYESKASRFSSCVT